MNQPASLALVSMTVWNHVGRLYIMAKLHIDTMKLATPTSMGTFCLTNAGGRTGSRAYFISITMNAMKKTMEDARGPQTVNDAH